MKLQPIHKTKKEREEWRKNSTPKTFALRNGQAVVTVKPSYYGPTYMTVLQASSVDEVYEPATSAVLSLQEPPYPKERGEIGPDPTRRDDDVIAFAEFILDALGLEIVEGVTKNPMPIMFEQDG